MWTGLARLGEISLAKTGIPPRRNELLPCKRNYPGQLALQKKARSYVIQPGYPGWKILM